MSDDHDHLRHLLGGLVLGGLAPADRTAIEAHLASCAECREELARLAPLPALLGRASVAPTEPAPPDLLPRLLDDVRRGRRRRLVLRGLVAAAAAAVVFATGWALAPEREAPQAGPAPAPAGVVDLAGTGASPGTSGTAALTSKPWGTALTLTATDLPPGGPYALEVVALDGSVERAASWGPSPRGRALVVGATSIPPEEIGSVVVRSAGSAVLSGQPGRRTGS